MFDVIAYIPIYKNPFIVLDFLHRLVKRNANPASWPLNL